MYHILIESKQSKLIACSDFDDVVANLKRIYNNVRMDGGFCTFPNNGTYQQPINDETIITIGTSVEHDGMELDFILQPSTDWLKTILGYEQ